MNLGNLADKLFELYDKKSELDQQRKELQEEIDQLERELIAEMDAEDLPKISSKLGSFTRKTELYPQVQDMDAFVQFAVENGYTSMLQKRINRGPFQEYFEETGMYPDGVDAFIKDTLIRRRNRQ